MNDFEYAINGKKVSADDVIDKLVQEKENLIKYINKCLKNIEEVYFSQDNWDEDFLGEVLARRHTYKDILERVKSGKYE